MSQPPAYSRAFSFTNYQAINPSAPIPGSQVDLELNNAKATLDAVLANLALIQRDDGGIKNATVGLDQLKAEVPVGFNAPVVWTTATAFSAGSSTVFQGSGFYRCVVAHTSGVFATDLAAGKWTLIVDLSAVPLVNASQIAVTPSGLLTSNAQTSLQALDTGKAPLSHTQLSSTISDSTAAGRALLVAADATAQNVLLGTASLGFQSGDVKETATLSLQSGWYYCDGSSKNRVTDVNLFNAITIQQSGVTTSGSAIVTGLSDTTNGGNTPMSPGMPISGTGIQSGTVVQSVDSGTQVTMSKTATVTATTALVFAPYGVGDGSTTFGIPNRAYIAVGRDNASGSASNVLQVSTNLSVTSGSTTATVGSAVGLFPGVVVSHPKVPNGTWISAISGTTITLSAAATGTASSTGRFSPLLDAQTLGATGGELSHVTTLAETAAHTHSNTVGETPHAHTFGATQSGNFAIGGAQLGMISPNSNGSGGAGSSTGTATAGVTISNASSGGGLAHNNQPKSIVMNFIIKR